MVIAQYLFMYKRSKLCMITYIYMIVYSKTVRIEMVHQCTDEEKIALDEIEGLLCSAFVLFADRSRNGSKSACRRRHDCVQ